MIKDKHIVINGLDYTEYLNSPEWRAKRLEVAEKANYTCSRCKKQILSGFHVHHRTYKHFGNELLSELEFLCPECHKKLHEKRDKQRYNPNRKRTKASCCYSQKKDGYRFCTLHNEECTYMCKDYVCRYTGQTKDEVRHADPDQNYTQRTAAVVRRQKRKAKKRKNKNKRKSK